MAIGEIIKCALCGTPFKQKYWNEKYCNTKYPRCSIMVERKRMRQSLNDKFQELEIKLERCKNEMSEKQLIKAGF